MSKLKLLTKLISDITTCILMIPVILVAACGLIIYWVCRFPFWYIERRKWYRIDK